MSLQDVYVIIHYVLVCCAVLVCDVLFYAVMYLQAAIYMSGNTTFVSVTEQIVRRAVSKQVAVMYLVETLTSPLAERTYHKACSLYNVPVVNYRKAVKGDVKDAEKLKINDPNVHYMKGRFSIFWPKYHSAPHPNW